MTHTEAAQYLSDAMGRKITFVDIPPDMMLDTLLSVHFPTWQAEGLIEDYAHYRRGEASAIASGVQDATGRSPRSFEAFAHDYAPMFS